MRSSSGKITYADIAKAAGVSAATVSRVVNQRELVKADTLQRIITAMQSLGCDTSKLLSVNPRDGEPCVLCIVPGIGNPFYGDVLMGIKAAAKAADYNLLIMDEIVSKKNISKIMSIIACNHIVGLIPLVELSVDTLNQLSGLVPLVQCCEYNEESNASFVSIDNIKATRNLMQYILASGRKKIAIITTNPSDFFYARLRLKGYYQAMEDAGMTVNPNWVVYLPEINFTISTSAISSLIQLNDRPDCVFCTSDVAAAAAIRCCAREKLRVPEDIMIVGFDNIDVSVMTSPTITTVNQPRFDIGYTACKYLTEAISNPNIPPQHTLLETEFIIRESTIMGRP